MIFLTYIVLLFHGNSGKYYLKKDGGDFFDVSEWVMDYIQKERKLLKMEFQQYFFVN